MNAVFIIRSRSLNTVINLDGGNTAHEARISPQVETPHQVNYHHQKWLITQVPRTQNYYTVTNVGSNTVMGVQGALVCGLVRDVGHPTREKSWKIVRDGINGYRYSTFFIFTRNRRV